jgi:hypothetical protein
VLMFQALLEHQQINLSTTNLGGNCGGLIHSEATS